jgi:hypothetical protein
VGTFIFIDLLLSTTYLIIKTIIISQTESIIEKIIKNFNKKKDNKKNK